MALTKLCAPAVNSIRLLPRMEQACERNGTERRHGKRAGSKDHREDAGKLGEAAIIARTASGSSGEKLPKRAFRTLLDTDNAATLLNAPSLVRRRERESAALG